MKTIISILLILCTTIAVAEEKTRDQIVAEVRMEFKGHVKDLSSDNYRTRAKAHDILKKRARRWQWWLAEAYNEESDPEAKIRLYQILTGWPNRPVYGNWDPNVWNILKGLALALCGNASAGNVLDILWPNGDVQCSVCLYGKKSGITINDVRECEREGLLRLIIQNIGCDVLFVIDLKKDCPTILLVPKKTK